MDKETKMMVNTIIDEMGRMEERINKRFEEIDEKMNNRFERIENRLDLMQQDINACKLEKDTIAILIRKIDQLEKRIEELERKTA